MPKCGHTEPLKSISEQLPTRFSTRAEANGYIVFVQDWRGHRIGYPIPPTLKTRFNTRAEAEHHKRCLREQFPNADAVLICLVPAPGAPRTTKKRGR
jgi:hypothetical protein